ncbi:hypothetical protein ACEPAF_5668 [Sanghuangporus sanghuang]
MTSNNVAPALVFNKQRPIQQRMPAKPHLPARPATSPTLPSPPVPPKDNNGSQVLKNSTNTEHRWSEVVPPATALTFAAIWDPEDGLVTFSGAALSASENNNGNVSPEDAESRSQVLSVDFLNVETAPNTAKDSLFPYSQSRFAASEVSTLRFPVSPTRRSSAGTGLAIDISVCPEVERRLKADGNLQRDRNSNFRYLDAKTAKSRKHTVPRAMHQHSSSQDSTSSNGLAAIGTSLYNALRRVATPKQGHTRADRYAFLRRTNEKMSDYGDHDERIHMREDDRGTSTPPKSPKFRSIFARSIWHRGAIGGGRDEELICRPQIQDDSDGVTLDSGFDFMDIDDDTDEAWPDNFGRKELDSALARDVNQLKSTFSWTTTSTSRYIDVAAYLDDSDTDSTVSSLGVPIASTVSPFHSQQANSISVHAQEGDHDSSEFRVEQATPRPINSSPQQQKPQRNLLRKTSKTQVSCPPSEKVSCKPQVSKAGQDQQRYQICPQCHLRIEFYDVEAEEISTNQKKGKGRTNSQPDLPDSLRNTVCLGRPAVVRSSSSPASMPFSHTRSHSLPGSSTATPAEVLARASYNHEWASPAPSRLISHVRSPSAPQQGSPSSTMSVRRPTTPTRSCQHFSDMRVVLRGVRSGIRPSTPIPGMPPVPPRTMNRPPPTSFRPVSASGRERSHSGTPTSFVSHSQGRFSQFHPLTRSQSHSASAQTPSSMRSRSRSLESLRGTAHALAAASTAPLRTLWRARSFMRNSHSDQPRRSDVDHDEDGVWVCVEVKTPDNQRKMANSTENPNDIGGSSSLVFASHPYRDASC